MQQHFERVRRGLDERLGLSGFEEEARAKRETLVWHALGLLDAPALAPFQVFFLCGFYALLARATGLVRGDVSAVHWVMVLFLAVTQLLAQRALAMVLRFAYLNYTWFLALARYLLALYQREFPAVEPAGEPSDEKPLVKAEPGVQTSEAYQQRVEHQWQRLASLLERYATNKRIHLRNDLARCETLFPENKQRLARQGYELEWWLLCDYENCLVPTRLVPDQASTCVLF